MKDAQNHKLTLYQSERMLAFLESKGMKMTFHIHDYQVVKGEFVTLHCEGCGYKLDFPGLSPDEAEVYNEQYFSNTGYAYQEK